MLPDAVMIIFFGNLSIHFTEFRIWGQRGSTNSRRNIADGTPPQAPLLGVPPTSPGLRLDTACLQEMLHLGDRMSWIQRSKASSIHMAGTGESHRSKSEAQGHAF